MLLSFRSAKPPLCQPCCAGVTLNFFGSLASSAGVMRPRWRSRGARFVTPSRARYAPQIQYFRSALTGRSQGFPFRRAVRGLDRSQRPSGGIYRGVGAECSSMQLRERRLTDQSTDDSFDCVFSLGRTALSFRLAGILISWSARPTVVWPVDSPDI